MAQTYQTRSGPSKGERRRHDILEATLRLIGRQGTAAVTHRAVAEEAGAALSATTYYFASKEDLLEQALMLAAEEEVARLEGILADLEAEERSLPEWADLLVEVLDVRTDRERAHRLASFELGLEAARTPALRGAFADWQAAHLRLAELGLRAAGAPDPAADAPVLVAALLGLDLAHLATSGEHASEAMRPAIAHLVGRLMGAGQTSSVS